MQSESAIDGYRSQRDRHKKVYDECHDEWVTVSRELAAANARVAEYKASEADWREQLRTANARAGRLEDLTRELGGEYEKLMVIAKLAWAIRTDTDPETPGKLDEALECFEELYRIHLERITKPYPYGEPPLSAAPQASTESRMATDAEVAEYHRGLAVEHAAAQAPTEQGCDGDGVGCMLAPGHLGPHRQSINARPATSPMKQVVEHGTCANCGSLGECLCEEVASPIPQVAQASADRPVMLSELVAALETSGNEPMKWLARELCGLESK
jgi:hypothetical protein